MKLLVIVVSLLLSFTFAQAGKIQSDLYPAHPHPELTPGELCQTASEYRYPEKIKYCERDVASETKRQIIRIYDSKLGYAISSLPREEFKIDHFIPLCMGGSNSTKNLWPQHVSVYEQTDHYEAEICESLRDGHISQAKAVETIRQIKLHPEYQEMIWNSFMIELAELKLTH